VAWVCHRFQLFLEPHFAWHAMPGAFALLAIVTSLGIALLLIAAKLLGIREFDELIARARAIFSRPASEAVIPAAPKNV
jgi:hypothetical protein